MIVGDSSSTRRNKQGSKMIMRVSSSSHRRKQGSKMRGSSSTRRRKQGSKMTRDATGSPAMTTDGYHGVVSHQQQDLGGLHRQDPTACITNQTAYNNATLAPPGGSTADYEPGPVVQTTKTVKEVEIGPGITLGCVSLKDFSFITTLPVVEEEQH